MNKTIKVAVVEDHEQFRSKLVELVTEAANLKLTGAYQDALTAIKGIPLAKPDLVLMDIRLPGKDGVECVRELKQSFPEMNFLMLTAYEDGDLLFESLKAGAGGYLLKRTSSTKLLDAIQELNSGGSPMTPQIARRVVEYFSKTQKSPRPDTTQLTPGQINFLEELSQGYSYKEIADHLGITVHGVRNYIRKIYDKLHVHSKVEAINKYLGR
ncbi:MAG TPA: response regulator transcription factor [Verrucomicrobiae bacterium]|jgi:DNA-binding NarL/FixJ family response regulator